MLQPGGRLVVLIRPEDVHLGVRAEGLSHPQRKIGTHWSRKREMHGQLSVPDIKAKAGIPSNAVWAITERTVGDCAHSLTPYAVSVASESLASAGSPLVLGFLSILLDGLVVVPRGPSLP